MADIELVIEIPEKVYEYIKHRQPYVDKYGYTYVDLVFEAVLNGTSLPKGHGRLKDEDEIVKAIEDRVEFLRKYDALFMRLRKDIDILGCIPKICCEVQTIIEADKAESEG